SIPAHTKAPATTPRLNTPPHKLAKAQNNQGTATIKRCGFKVSIVSIVDVVVGMTVGSSVGPADGTAAGTTAGMTDDDRTVGTMVTTMIGPSERWPVGPDRSRKPLRI
ncbi:hypothetical protein, partial [Bifidobacterium catulorum]|uniref:hypothetical protein n=1 Tax=Bifidobacterium catulorum TaxID=1630173 RepID=UPI0019D4E20B